VAPLHHGSGWLFYDRQVNGLRRELGLSSLCANTVEAWKEAERTVMLLSCHYFGEGAADWPPVTWGGFSHWSGPNGRRPDPGVDTFVDGGDPPVLVSLGTSATTGGRRAVRVHRCWAGRARSAVAAAGGDPANLGAVAHRDGALAFAPLASVLPRCRAAVVSGSLGTLAAALAAGVPVVVVPQLFAQVWHGGQVERLGVGVLARRSRDVPRAVARIEADPGYRRRALDLARRMSADDGPGALADAVESVL
jgi:rhamnosyltransferase subunit B